MRRHSYRAGRAELLFKVKRHNQALPNSRINSDAFSLHMRYESAMRFLRKTRIRFRVIEMRTPRALQCWPRICDRFNNKSRPAHDNCSIVKSGERIPTVRQADWSLRDGAFRRGW